VLAEGGLVAVELVETELVRVVVRLGDDEGEGAGVALELLDGGRDAGPELVGAAGLDAQGDVHAEHEPMLYVRPA
jgi:hypothetical protein